MASVALPTHPDHQDVPSIIPPRISSSQRSQAPYNSPTSARSEHQNSPQDARRPSADYASSPLSNRDRHDRTRQNGVEPKLSIERERAKDDPASAAAAAARSRRRAQQSPREDPTQRSPNTREGGARKFTQANQKRSTVDPHSPSSPHETNIPREGSTIINRVVVTDPEVDIQRERERVAEAQPSSPSSKITPVTGLGLVSAEGVDDGGRGGGKSRQDHSSSRRKETRFGDYILGQTLGEGEFGKVKMGWKKDGGVQVAIKLIRRESLGTNPSRLPKIYREISILRGLSHPNIVRLHEMVETERQIGIILEYASGGELFDYILNHRYLKDQAARRLFAQLVSGVGYLHKKGIVHRDLKLENLLLDRNRNIIITDFGFANTFDPNDELGDEIEYSLSNKEFVKKADLDRVRDNGHRRGDLMQTSCGSPCYAAPELVVSDSLYTGRKVDVWSCGVILYAMLAGYLPFDDDPANPEGDNINLLYKYIVSTPLTFPEYVTPHARDLLRRILVPDPRKRADLFEVARHSWLSEYAHVVSFITSSTTTSGDISNTTVTADDQQEVPLLARSASVREPSKPYQPTTAVIGGLTTKQGKIDPEAQTPQSKTTRDAKRRTVQVEYVAPQSQTTRGDPSGAVTMPDISSAAAQTPRTRGRSGSQGQVGTPSKGAGSAGRTASTSKPLPAEPYQDPVSQAQAYQSPAPQTRTRQRPSSSTYGSKPPTRPVRDMPRAASDSVGAFATTPGTSSGTRPDTGGSLAANDVAANTGLPSRGSYSRPGQPAAPTVATANAQGRLAQPQGGRQYVISNPAPQSGGRNSTVVPPTDYDDLQSYQTKPARGHKRSNTVGGIAEKLFGRSGSILGRPKSQVVPDQAKEKLQKSYPPTSMPAAMSGPRASIDSRRSSSFGFGRKNSNLGEKSARRFSLLGALSGKSRDSTSSRPGTMSEQRDFGSSSGSRGRHEPRVMAFGGHFAPSRSTSRGTGNSVQNGYDGHFEASDVPSGAPARATQLPHDEQLYNDEVDYRGQNGSGYNNLPVPADDGLATESETSLNAQRGQQRPAYPAGFDSYEHEEERLPNRWSRGPNVLQKNNRRFVDAYQQEGEHRHGAAMQSSGSSGAARKVMDFFRRRGRARTEA